MPDAALPAEVALDVARGIGAPQWLRHRERAVAHMRAARLERRRDALVEVEVEVPRLEVLEQMRDVHVRSLAEVVLRPEVDVAKRLVVRDQARAERVLLC